MFHSWRIVDRVLATWRSRPINPGHLAPPSSKKYPLSPPITRLAGRRTDFNQFLISDEVGASDLVHRASLSAQAGLFVAVLSSIICDTVGGSTCRLV